VEGLEQNFLLRHKFMISGKKAKRPSDASQPRGEQDIIYCESSTEELKSRLPLDDFEKVSIQVSGIKYTNFASACFRLTLTRNYLRYSVYLARDNYGTPSYLRGKELQPLLGKYFLRTNDSLRMGCFNVDPRTGIIQLRIQFDFGSMGLAPLGEQVPAAHRSNIIRTMISTASRKILTHVTHCTTT
jgi:hypothetical protein